MKLLLLLVLLASSAFAQTDLAKADACRTKSLATPVADPAKVIQAQEDAFQRCIAAALPDKQRRQLALYKSAQTVCNDTADNEVKRDSLTTAAERTKIYTRCMKGAGYQ